MSDNNNNNETSSCFWLPSEFFTDDDFLMENQNKNTTTQPHSSFPNYYHLETNNKNCWAMSTSPQSTLAHYRSWAGSSNGSPQGLHSPPTTPFGNENKAVRDLIDKAANQVATLHLTDNFGHGPTNNYLGPNSPTFVQNTQLQWKMGQGGWTVQQDPTRFKVESGSVNRKCAGTGVFLPRVNTPISSNASDSRKKPGCSFGMVPDRVANHGFSLSRRTPQPQFNQGYIQNYESLIARRNSIISQQRELVFVERSLMMNRDMYLPQEWSY